MVNVDTVYQRVLALANKEQRGYITPQEFNLYANQAQMDIFEQYFYDLSQFRRVPGNDSKYADIVDILEEKLSYFKQGPTQVTDSTPLSDLSTHSPSLFYRLGDITYGSRVVEEIRYEDYHKTQMSPLTKATSSRPIYWRKDGRIYFSDQQATFQASWIRKPTKVNWTYIIVGDVALVNPSETAGYQDFDLPPSEETKLVIKILELSGITLKDNGLYQISSTEENEDTQQKKK